MQSVKFVTSSAVPDRFHCNICTNVLTDPELAVCCGQHYCNGCLKQWFVSQHKKSCPHCRAEGSNFSHVLNKSLKCEINQLKVHCSNHSAGCTWTGELGDLKEHIESQGGCHFATVNCTNECGAKTCRKDLQNHVQSHCPLRQETCSYCKKQDTFRAMQSHLEVCPKCLIQCPNSCSVRNFPREELKNHFKVCPNTMNVCPFKEVGCAVRDRPDEVNKHVAASQAQHMILLLESNKKLALELQEAKRDVHIVKEECNLITTKFEEQIKSLETTKRSLAFEVEVLQNCSSVNDKIGAFRSIQTLLEDIELNSGKSLILRVLEFSKHYQAETAWYSPSFILEGCRVCLSVHPKGLGSGSETHASLSLVLLGILSPSPDPQKLASALEEIRILVPLFKHAPGAVHRVFLKEVKGSLPFDLSPLKPNERQRVLGTNNNWIPLMIIKGELKDQAFVIKVERPGGFGDRLLEHAIRARATPGGMGMGEDQDVQCRQS